MIRAHFRDEEYDKFGHETFLEYIMEMLCQKHRLAKRFQSVFESMCVCVKQIINLSIPEKWSVWPKGEIGGVFFWEGRMVFFHEIKKSPPSLAYSCDLRVLVTETGRKIKTTISILCRLLVFAKYKGF